MLLGAPRATAPVLLLETTFGPPSSFPDSFYKLLFGIPFAHPGASPLRIPNRILGVPEAAGGQKESEKETGPGEAKGIRKRTGALF